jgi:cytochrome c-type biogenesis protein CcmH/NrfG
VLLDRRKVKFWQRIVFGGMAVLMAAFLVFGYSGILNGCDFLNSEESATKSIDQEIAAQKTAIQTNPKDADAWRALGEQYVLRANQETSGSDAQKADWRQAAKAYVRANKLLAKQKGSAAKQQRLDTLDQLVSVYIFLEDYQLATSAYGEITALRPKDAQSFFDMATIAIRAGDTNTALLAFSKFLELDPKSQDAAAVKDWIAKNAPSPTPTKESGQ